MKSNRRRYTFDMCGIAGIGKEDPELMKSMVDALSHRGPDGQGIWTGKGASLGHARLAILDPRPAGDQPMWNASHTIGIVYNGEIFNFRELRDEEKLVCRTGTDTEVILQLYERYGMNFVHRLRGMFAFGIFDTRNHSWHLARDTGGIKPLFIAYPQGILAFASEMRALLRIFPTKPTLNMRSLSLYVRLQYVPGPETMCEGIEQLPPGTLLSWKDGKEIRSTFHPEETCSFRTKKEFREQFPTIMDTVVAQHLVSDKPVGIFLSGGMDSSIILHHMCAHARKPVQTFTIRFDATEEEGAARFNADADLAARTAKHYGTTHHEVFFSAAQFRALYKETARAVDQPNANPVAVAQYLLAQEAKKHVDVVLNGSGGDELFGGYPRYKVARILHMFRSIPAPLRALGGRISGYPPDVLRMQPGPALAKRLLSRPIQEGLSVAKGDWFDPDATTVLFQNRFASLHNPEILRSFMECDRQLWLVDESLRLMDGTTMGSGLECRVPFVDERIIHAAHATPAHWHVTPRHTKVLLKQIYLPMLPPHLRTLSKAGFYPPMAKWLRREAAPLAEAMLEHRRIGEWFDNNHLRMLFEEHRDRKGYHLHILSSMIQLSHWFDEVYDAR